MALVKYFFADMRGKVAGLVASANKGGAYFRQKVTPLNPQSEQQQNIRSILTDVARSYSQLTDVQRDGWKRLANAQPYMDIFGDMKKLNAIAMFIKVNAMNAMCQAAQLSDAPQNLHVRGLDPVEIAVTSSINRQFTVTYGPVNTADESLLIYTATSIAPSIGFVKNLYRVCMVAGGLNPSPITVTSPSHLGPFVDGTKLWVKVARCNNLTGGVTIAQEKSVTIA